MTMAPPLRPRSLGLSAVLAATTLAPERSRHDKQERECPGIGKKMRAGKRLETHLRHQEQRTARRHR